jgi:hypothetical protein
MKLNVDLRKPFGQSVFSRIRHARYLTWKDAFDVVFTDGFSFLEPHGTIRRADKITASAIPIKVEEETHSGFFVHYDNGQTAEISLAFIRELPPKVKLSERYEPQFCEESRVDPIKKRALQFTTCP